MSPTILRILCGSLLVSLVACTGTETTDAGSSSSSGNTTGGGCSNAADCPDGFACRARECMASCSSNQPLTGGCVVGATCDNGTCRKNTACNENIECAYDKGEVCHFASGTCVAASNTCSEGENETLCANGYLCHIKVCYLDCEGSKGCPTGQTCTNNACN